MDTDKSNMKQTIMDFPGQFPIGYGAVGDSGKELTDKKYSNIAIAGMGGSALPGELLALLSNTIGLKLPVIVHRDYDLEKQVSKDSLVIAMSYSGNTEETLSAYKKAKERGATLAVITSDGSLEQMAANDGVPFALVPEGVQPRLAIGYQFSALLGILANAGVIEPKEKEMRDLSSEIKSATTMSLAKKLADEIKERTPLIYSSQKNKPLAYIMKIQMNENGKRHAFYNSFPELNHNEMMGYKNSDPDRFFTLMLRDSEDHPRNQKRMELSAEILEDRGFKIRIIDIEGENMYNRAFNTILLGNWLSYYLAIQDDIDPTPVDIIEEFKQKLG